MRRKKNESDIKLEKFYRKCLTGGPDDMDKINIPVPFIFKKMFLRLKHEDEIAQNIFFMKILLSYYESNDISDDDFKYVMKELAKS